MSGQVLQQLVLSGEYDEFDDIIIVEGEFIEFDSSGCAVRQIILGISPLHLVKADRRIPNYKTEPEIFYETNTDPYLDGLELSSVIPLCVISINYSPKAYELEVDVNGNQRYYLLCTTQFNGDLDDTWSRWVRRIQYIQNDPYHYIRDMLDEHHIPYPDHYQDLEIQETLEMTAKIDPPNTEKTTVVNSITRPNSSSEFSETVKTKDDESLLRHQFGRSSNKHGCQKKEKKKRNLKKTIFSWKYLYLKRKRR